MHMTVKIMVIPEEINYFDKIKASLEIAGVDPEGFDILDQDPVVLPSLINPEGGMACFAAVSKVNGMVLLFAFKTDKQEENSIIVQ